MEDKQYLEDLMILIKEYFNTQKQFANTLKISPTILSGVLTGNRTLTMQFKQTVYNGIKNQSFIPNETKDKFKVETTFEFDFEKEINNLTKRIGTQISTSQEHLSISESNPILDTYNILYEELNKLKYSIGAIDNRSLHYVISDLFSKLSPVLYEYVLYHSYSKVNELEILSVNLILFDNPVSFSDDYGEDITIGGYFILPLNSLGNQAKYGDVCLVKKINADSLHNVDYNQNELYYDYNDITNVDINLNLEDISENTIVLCRIQKIFESYYVPFIVKYKNNVISEKSLYYTWKSKTYEYTYLIQHFDKISISGIVYRLDYFEELIPF